MESAKQDNVEVQAVEVAAPASPSVDKKREREEAQQSEGDAEKKSKQDETPKQSAPSALTPYKAVVLDIEGTTTPISFVKEVLFPFALAQLPGYLDRMWGTESLNKDIGLLRQQASSDSTSGIVSVPIPEFDCAEEKDAEKIAEFKKIIYSNVQDNMNRDRKLTGLKSLQGNIWQEGYKRGELLGSVYEDVVVAFRRWKESSLPVYIYSSGSVAAQKLLFGYSDHGDLLPFLTGHFDTTTGPKVEALSYTKIVEAINLAPSDVLFLTDSEQEAVAARAAGLKVGVAVRPGNSELTALTQDIEKISTFDVLF